MDIQPDLQRLLENFAPRIYEIVMLVPRGRVTNYGAIAQIIGDPTCDARLVGSAMAQVTSDSVPWQRVVNRQGTISIHDPFGKNIQRQLLEEEGVHFDSNDRIDFKDFGWMGVP